MMTEQKGNDGPMIFMTKEDEYEMEKDTIFESEYEHLNTVYENLVNLVDMFDDGEQIEELKEMRDEAYEDRRRCEVNNARRRLNGGGRVVAAFMASISNSDRRYIENNVRNGCTYDLECLEDYDFANIKENYCMIYLYKYLFKCSNLNHRTLY